MPKLVYIPATLAITVPDDTTEETIREMTNWLSSGDAIVTDANSTSTLTQEVRSALEGSEQLSELTETANAGLIVPEGNNFTIVK